MVIKENSVIDRIRRQMIVATDPNDNKNTFYIIHDKYLQQYVDGFCFRLNHRDCNDAFLKCVQLAV